jgi:hypothetical protein
MNRTHEQRECGGCGTWAIWYPRPAGAMATCWGCGHAKVDPALFGEDDELRCHACQARIAAQHVADQQAWDAAQAQWRWADVT